MYQIYQVQPGETIDIVASKFGIAKDKLKEINGLVSDMIYDGSYLIVPANNNNTQYQKYIVKKGDSIYSIARQYNVDYNSLMKLNGLNAGEYIYPDQELLIPMGDRKVYVTKEGDTISSIMNELNIPINKLMSDNENLYLATDQIIKY